MHERLLSKSPSWFLAVMGISFAAGLYLMDTVFHGSGPLDPGIHLLRIILAFVALTICGVATRMWWLRGRAKNTSRD